MGGAVPKPLRAPVKMAFGGDTSPANVQAVKKIAPTQAEVSQATATEEQGLTAAQRARRRGRSATILTSTMGVEGETTLGKKSLLGG